MIEFEWDPKKAEANLRKHHVAFQESTGVFQDPMSITFYDPDHSEDEERFITIGFSSTGGLLMVAHTDRGKRIRIISARHLARVEREAYHEEIKRRKG
jgi:uncharacterized protein